MCPTHYGLVSQDEKRSRTTSRKGVSIVDGDRSTLTNGSLALLSVTAFTRIPGA